MRTLIYTCADKKYSQWIPLYCLSMLMFNKDIDIEIGMEGKLESKEKEAIEYIRNQYPKSTILIKEDFFIKIGEKKAFVESQNITTLFTGVRFVTTPTLKADYVYIGDIDIIILEPIVEQHLNHMKETGCNYSNIVRKYNPLHMSGLHFSKWDSYYPLPDLSNIDLLKNCEQVLKDMVYLKGNYVDLDTEFRPVHGIHCSINRPTVKEGKIVGWGAEPWKEKYTEFIKTSKFKSIESSFGPIVKGQLKKLNEFYYAEQ